MAAGQQKWRRVSLRFARPGAAFTFLLVLAIAGVSGAVEPQGTGHRLSSVAFTEAESKSGSGRAIPFFLSASDELGRQGFVRVINHSTEAGEVSITAFDDEGESYGPLTLSLAAHETAHFNSDDLEYGNPAKGLMGGTGAGQGDWRLDLASGLNIEVLSYVRTSDGFLTSMHDTVPLKGDAYRVATFNPVPTSTRRAVCGSSTQAKQLRK